MIVITGDSHVTALAKAFRSMKIDKSQLKAHALGNGAYFCKPFFEHKAGSVILSNKQMISFNKAFLLQERTFRPEKAKKLILSLGFYSSRVTKHSDWKTHKISGGYENGKERSFVSTTMVEELAKHDIRFIAKFYAALKDVGVDVIAVPAPPPSIRMKPLKKGVPAERIKEINDTYQRVARQACAEAGVRVLSRPTGCTNELGFLAEEFAHEKPKDTLHAGMPYALKQAQIIIDEVGL